MRKFILIALLGLGACSDLDNPMLSPEIFDRFAPVLSVSVPTLSVDEGQTLTFDASASIDPFGDTLTFEVELVATEFAELQSDASDPIWTLISHQVDQDETVWVRVSATNRLETVTEEFEVAIENYDRTPISADWNSVAEDSFLASDTGGLKLTQRPYPDNFYFLHNRMLHALRTGESGNLEVLEFDFQANPALDAPRIIELGAPIGADPELNAAKLPYTEDAPSFAVHSAQSETAQIYTRDTLNSVFLGGNLSLPGLCNLYWQKLFSAPPSWGLVVGAETALWTWLDDERNSPIIGQSGMFSDSQIRSPTGRYCHSGRGNVFYDEVRGEFDFATFENAENSTFPRPVSMALPNDLFLVDMDVGIDAREEEFIALLFAADAHDGPHQLTLLSQSPSGLVVQQDIALPAGIPADMVVGSVDTDPPAFFRQKEANIDSDIVIAVPDTPYVYVIRTDYSELDGLTVAPIEYFEVGFGIDEITLAITQLNHKHSLITNDGQTLRRYINAN